MPDSLYLLDVYSLVFQVFHAIPEMTGPQGQPTNAVFGFTRDILNILRQKRPTHLICATDPPGPGEREKRYPAYKATRGATPPELVPQFPMIAETIAAFGIPVIELPGWEADDVIATVVEAAHSRDVDVFIVSNDKDIRQLLSSRVKIYHVRKEQYLDEAGLLTEWGVRPDQVIDFQALVGDSVDNVPGVPLVGPKKASALLAQWGTLDEVLAHADEAPGAKLRENLKQFAEQARISRDLVALRRDLPLTIDWEAARVGRWDVDHLQDLFRRFGFRRFGDEVRELAAGGGPAETRPAKVEQKDAEFRLPNSDFGLEAPDRKSKIQNRKSKLPRETVAATASPAQRDLFAAEAPSAPVRPAPASAPPAVPAGVKRALHFTIVHTPEKLTALVRELEAGKKFCLDLETTSIDPVRADIVGWAISREPNRGFYIAVRGPAGQPVLNPAAVVAALKPVLENPDVEVVNQNIKYDMLVLRRAGITLRGIGMDPMIASYLLEAGARTHNLDELARRYLGHEMIPISSLVGKGLFQKRMDEVEVERVAEYAVEDAEVAWELADHLGRRLREQGLWDLYWTLERPLIEVLAEMQHNGIAVDVEKLREQSADIETRLTGIREQIYALAGREFNIDSPKQLQQILFTELGLPVVRKTKTGASTDQDVLEQLAPQHPLPSKLLEHRSLSKLKNTYLDALPGMVNPETKKIHTSFNQVVAATGRLSSSDPNLQNIPVRTAEGQRVRQAFVPSRADWQLVCADYSQIELRMLAHYSRDAELQKAFREGVDIHSAVASEIFRVTPDGVDAEMRRIAKAVNFGVIYGQSPFGLAANLGITQAAAAEFIDGYFARYAGVDRFLEELLAECARSGFARTILGRRRAIEGIRKQPQPLRQRNLPERTAINTVIQGSAADLIKQAMINVYRRLQHEGHPGKILLQIHDELVLEGPADRVADLATLVREEMEQALKLDVPLKVDVSAGSNWLDVDPVES